MNKIKKIGLIAAGVVVVALGSGAAWWFLHSTPEDVLYSALAKDTPYGHLNVQSATAGDSKADITGILKPDGTMKADGTMSCKGTVADVGDLQMQIEFRQIQAETFMHFNNIAIVNATDKDTQKQANDFFQQSVNGKWVQIDDKDITALSLKEDGVVFGTANAVSKKMDGTQIANLLKKDKVLTILNVTHVTSSGKPATQYDLLVRRSAYDAFIDDVQPGFKYKDKTLDNLFEGDTADSSVVIDNASGKIVSGVDSEVNPCADLIGIFDPGAAGDLPSHIKVKSSYKDGNDMPSATKPKDFLSIDQFAQLLNGE